MLQNSWLLMTDFCNKKWITRIKIYSSFEFCAVNVHNHEILIGTAELYLPPMGIRVYVYEQNWFMIRVIIVWLRSFFNSIELRFSLRTNIYKVIKLAKNYEYEQFVISAANFYVQKLFTITSFIHPLLVIILQNLENYFSTLKIIPTVYLHLNI